MLSLRLIEVQESERRKFAKELHEEIGQVLMAVKISLQTVNTSSDTAQIKKKLDDSVKLIENILNQVRNISLDLRPSMLDDLGLVPALRWYVDRQSKRTNLKVQMNAEPIGRKKLASEVENICYWIAREALTNVIRHSEAENIKIEIWIEDEQLYLKYCG